MDAQIRRALEASQQREPNRYRGLYGAGQASVAIRQPRQGAAS
jgi:hypothetical protein